MTPLQQFFWVRWLKMRFAHIKKSPANENMLWKLIWKRVSLESGMWLWGKGPPAWPITHLCPRSGSWGRCHSGSAVFGVCLCRLLPSYHNLSKCRKVHQRKDQNTDQSANRKCQSYPRKLIWAITNFCLQLQQEINLIRPSLLKRWWSLARWFWVPFGPQRPQPL